MNIPLLLMIPLLCGGICIITTLLRLNLLPLKHTCLPLHFSWECHIVSYTCLYLQNCWKPNVSLKSFFFQVNCTRWSKKCFFFLPCSAPWVTSSLYLTIFSAETGTCGECFYVLGCAEGGGGWGGRKQRDNSLKAVSVVGRLQKTGQHSEIKNRYTTLSCPQSNCALICSKKSIDVSDSTFPPAFFSPLPCNDSMCCSMKVKSGLF